MLQSLFQPLATSHQPLALALSGGSDSLALALLLREAKIPFTALTVDHQLRSESAAEAAQVAVWMAQYGIPHQILRWQRAGERSGNLLAAARAARYQLLTDACKKAGIATLLVAHTQDDQAETIALRQERRSGAVGLAGISARVTVNGVTVLRPLLANSRAELRAYLQAQGQGWIDDPSNANTDFDRIRIRQFLAVNPEKKQALLALGVEMAAQRQRLEDNFADFVAEAVRQTPQGLFVVQATFLALTEEAACDALSRMLRAVSGRDYPPRYRELQRLWQQMQQQPQGAATLGKCQLRWEGKEMRIMQQSLVKRPANAHIHKEEIPPKPLVGERFWCITDVIKESTL